MLSDESDHKSSQSEDSTEEYSNNFSGKSDVEEKSIFKGKTCKTL